MCLLFCFLEGRLIKVEEATKKYKSKLLVAFHGNLHISDFVSVVV